MLGSLPGETPDYARPVASATRRDIMKKEKSDQTRGGARVE
jgi:hypothetical protein